MEYIKKEELIEGEIYKSTLYNHIFKYLDKNGDNNITCSATHFNKDCATIGNGLNNIINATPEEKHWLNTCIQQDKFITFEEAMKSFIPEYVECLKDYFTQFSKGSIYKVIKSLGNNYNMIDDEKSMNGWAKSNFKPSTKEAYDAQFVVKEPEFVLPEMWCITTTAESSKIIQNWRDMTGGSNYRNKDIGVIFTSTKGYIQGWIPSAINRKIGYTEITFEQFKKYVLKEENIVEEIIIKEPVIENKTELEIWLEDTKTLNLSLGDLTSRIGSCNFMNIYKKLEGYQSKEKAKILFDKWNKKVIEPLPQFKVIETIETITKVENNEGNQFFIGDVVKSEPNFIQTIKSFKYNTNKTNLMAVTSRFTIDGININKIEHYIEPKVEVKDEFVLPEKWCIKNTEFLIGQFFNSKIKVSCYTEISHKDCYLHSLDNEGSNILTENLNASVSYRIIKTGFTEITFDQFKKYILKEENKPVIIAQSHLDQLKLAEVGITSIITPNETLLEKAKRLYPIGTKVNSLGGSLNQIIDSNTPFMSSKNGVRFTMNCLVYFDGKWADIVK